MSWMQRLKRVFHIDIEHCAVCGATLRVIACIDTPLKCRSRSELARSSRGASLISPPARPTPSTTPAHRRSVWAPRNPAPPFTDPLPTAPTGAPRPRCLSPPALRPPACLTRSHHGRLHQIASPRPRNVCARTDNVPDNIHTSSTTPLLPQQRRSAGYFAYPSEFEAGGWIEPLARALSELSEVRGPFLQDYSRHNPRERVAVDGRDQTPSPLDDLRMIHVLARHGGMCGEHEYYAPLRAAMDPVLAASCARIPCCGASWAHSSTTRFLGPEPR